MRARTLLSCTLVIAACARGTDVTSVPPEQAQAVVALPEGASLIVAPTTAPSGLAACWSAEGNANDIANGNNGTVAGSVTFVPGKFGQAFSFNALGGEVNIPTSSTLNVATGDGFTFSAWVFPKGTVFGPTVGAGPIVEFDNGAQLWQHEQFTDPTKGLFANLAESGLIYHIFQVGGVVTPGQWNHAAVTYSKATGTITLYANGVPSALTTAGVFTANTATTLHIGARVPGSFGTTQFTFNGLIDEVQVYNRALSGAEVASLTAATGTLCAPQPRQLGITTQPTGAMSGVLLGTQPVVAVRDWSNATVAGATNAVTAAIASGPGTLSGTTTVNAVDGVATFTDLRITGAGTSTLVFSSTGLTSVTSNPIAITPAPAALAITTQPSGAESGVAFLAQPGVEVRDAANVLVPGSTNAVTVAIASGTGALSGTTTVNAVNGVATFTDLVIAGSGDHTLVFTSPALTSAASAPFAVTQVVRALVVTTQPLGAVSGTPLLPASVIELHDAAGLLVASATDAVTATVASGPGALSGTTSVNAVAGVATFPNLIITGAGSYTLRFALGGGTASVLGGAPSVVSSSLVVTAPPVDPFDWQGFFEPIGNLPNAYSENAGRAIPVKFSLGGDKGMNIFAAGYPASQAVSCTTWLPAGPLQSLVLNAPLRFDGGMYSFVWKTDKAWGGTCRVLNVKLTDGVVHTARFGFGK